MQKLAIIEPTRTRWGGLHTIRGVSALSIPKMRCHSSSNGAATRIRSKTRPMRRHTGCFVVRQPYKPRKIAQKIEVYKRRCGGSQKLSLPIAPCHHTSHVPAITAIKSAAVIRRTNFKDRLSILFFVGISLQMFLFSYIFRYGETSNSNIIPSLKCSAI